MSHTFQNIKYHGLLFFKKKPNGAVTRIVPSGPFQRLFLGAFEREFYGIYLAREEKCLSLILIFRMFSVFDF